MTRLRRGRLARLSLGAVMLAAATVMSGAVHPAVAQPAPPDGGGNAASGRVAIRARNYAYDAPDTVPSGITTFTFQNAGADTHMTQFVRLNPGVTAGQVKAAVQTGQVLDAFGFGTAAGGANAAPPGAYQEVTLDLAPGNYVMLCFVYDDDDPVPHAAKGMLQGFQVVPPATEAAAPEADITVTAKEHDFAVPAISAGQHIVRFVNQGQQPHEMALLKLAEGAAAGDEEFVSQSETTPAGGIAVIPPGSSGWATVDFTPGLWLMVCYVPDTTAGQPHATLGMSTVIRVD